MNKEKEKLDCLLISAPIFYKDDGNIWKEINSNFPPMGLTSIAGFVRAEGFSTKIIDCNIHAPAVDLFRKYFEEEYVKKYFDIRVIGFTVMTCMIKKAYAIAKICKEYYPNAKIVFGGVHTTFCTEEVLEQEIVDIAILGEGEHTMKEILEGKKLRSIDGIAYRDVSGNRGVVKNKPRARILNLDELPMPAYDLLPILEYRPAKGSYKKLPAMAMMTSRGCPGRCTFCSKALGNQMVFKSAKTIFKEIKYLVDNYGIRQLLFYDDTFTVFKKNVHDLCDMLIKNKMNLSWTCFARVDFIDLDLLKKMKKAGCHQVMYGVENIDATVLKNINKQINKEQVEKAVAWTKKAKIECRLAFMVGNPGDNVEIAKKNLEFVKKLEPDLLVVNITTPFPGTEMFDWAKERDLILSYDWDDYTLAKPVMKLEELSVEEIQDLYKVMYRGFYFRPKFMIKKLFSIRSISDLEVMFSGFKALLSFFKKKEA